MATKIRLARFCKKHQPSYRIVVSASRTKRDGKVIETLGFFNPSLLELPKKDGHDSFKIDTERLNYWLGTGAQPTDAVSQLVNNTYEYKRYYKGKTAGEEVLETVVQTVAESPEIAVASETIEEPLMTEKPAEDDTVAPLETEVAEVTPPSDSPDTPEV